jgi:hypothetical protein
MERVCDKYALPKKPVEMINQIVSYSRYQILKGRHPFATGSNLGG